jgi:hypothetical protein
MKKDIKTRKTYDLRLTKFELLHLRDLFSVVLPPDVSKTLSQALAQLEERSLVESMLWSKIAAACEVAGLPMGDEAPDYVVAPNTPPGLGVFQLASDPPEGEEEEDDEEDVGSLFIKPQMKSKDEEE